MKVGKPGGIPDFPRFVFVSPSAAYHRHGGHALGLMCSAFSILSFSFIGGLFSEDTIERSFVASVLFGAEVCDFASACDDVFPEE
jgi:hypothetical protein